MLAMVAIARIRMTSASARRVGLTTRIRSLTLRVAED
jgi:hypothetical protein